MTLADPRPPDAASGDLCVNCQRRPATLNWVSEGGTLAYIHGYGQRWCEQCAVEAQIALAEKLAAMLPERRQRLAALKGEAS